MNIIAWGASDVGRTRQVNEDCHILAPDLGLLAVADGMGGHERGDVASQLACNVVKESIVGRRKLLNRMAENPEASARKAVSDLLENAVQRASSEVFEASEALAGDGRRMGTTLDVLLVVGSTAFVAHVGDGRVYLIRDGAVHQLTRDHSVIEQRLARGEISSEEAKTSPQKNLITRALGVFDHVEVDVMTFELLDADKLLLCSDGLYRYIGPQELGETLRKRMDPDCPGRLIALANRRGGRDNLTAICVELQAENTEEMELPTRHCMEVLRQVPMLQFCTYRELMSLYDVGRLVHLEANEVLFCREQPGRSAYVLISGTLILEREGSTVALVRSGQCIGELSLVRHIPRSCDARTLEDCEILVMDRDRFLQILKEDTELGSKLSWHLLKRLSRLVGPGIPEILMETLEPIVRD